MLIGAAICIYAYAYHRFPPSEQAALRITTPTTAPGAKTPAPLPMSASAVLELYEACVQPGQSTRATASQRVAACTQALETQRLTREEVAFARLSRGTARKLLGDRILATDDYLEALNHYDSAIDSENIDSLKVFRRAATLDALGQDDLALRDYNEAIRLDPSPVMAYFQRGVLLATRKRAFDKAIVDFDKVLAVEPDNVEGLIRRGDAYSQLGNAGSALVDLDRAVALAPDDPRAYLFRGIAHARRGEQQVALLDYDAALQRDPRYAEAMVSRAAIYAMAGRQDLSIEDLDHALAIDSENAIAYYNRGYSNFALHRYQAAMTDYDSAIKYDPMLGVAFNNRCLVGAIVHNPPEQTLADCDKALSLLPLSLDVRETRGFVYLRLGMPANAIVEYNAALDIDPNRSLALYGRGLARIRSGQAMEGEHDQAAARAIDPEVVREYSVYMERSRP